MSSLRSVSKAPIQSGLLDLLLVLVRTIFELVYENSSSNPLGSLRRTSRVCRRECERLLFQSISLGDISQELRLKSQGLLKRLQNPNDELADHVRELQLGPFADEGGYFANKALLRKAVDGTSMPYSTWFNLMQKTLYKAMPSPVADEPKSLASWEQDEKDECGSARADS